MFLIKRKAAHVTPGPKTSSDVNVTLVKFQFVNLHGNHREETTAAGFLLKSKTSLKEWCRSSSLKWKIWTIMTLLKSNQEGRAAWKRLARLVCLWCLCLMFPLSRGLARSWWSAAHRLTAQGHRQELINQYAHLLNSHVFVFAFILCVYGCSLEM